MQKQHSREGRSQLADEPDASGGRTPTPGPPRGSQQSAAAASRIRVDVSDVTKLKTAIKDTQTQAKSLSDTLAAFDSKALPTIRKVRQELEAMQRALGTSGMRSAAPIGGGGAGSGGGGSYTAAAAGTFGGRSSPVPMQRVTNYSTTGLPTYDQFSAMGQPQVQPGYLSRGWSYLTSPAPSGTKPTPPGWSTTPLFRGAVAALGGVSSLANLAAGHMMDATARSYLLNQSQLLTGGDIGTNAQTRLGSRITSWMGNTGLSYTDVSQAFGTLTMTGVMGGAYGASRMGSVGFLSAINPTQGNTVSAQQVASTFTSQNYYRMRLAGVNASIASGQNIQGVFDGIITRIEGAMGRKATNTEIMSGLQQGTHLNADLTAMGISQDLLPQLIQYWAARNRTGQTGMAAVNAAGGRNNLAFANQQAGAAKARALSNVDKGFIPGAEAGARLRGQEYNALGAMADTPVGRGLTEAAGALGQFTSELSLATKVLKGIVEWEIAKMFLGGGKGIIAKGAGAAIRSKIGQKVASKVGTKVAQRVGTTAAEEGIGETVAADAGLGPIGWGLGALELGVMGLNLFDSGTPGKNWQTPSKPATAKSPAIPSATADQIGQAQQWVQSGGGGPTYAKLRNQHPDWSEIDIYSVIGQRFPKVRPQFQNQKPGTDVTMDPLTGTYSVTPSGGAAAGRATRTGGGSRNTQKGPTASKNVISVAERFLGTPYRWGGSSPRTGFDCSGLVQYAYAQAGITLPRTAADQEQVGTPVDPNNVQPGDLLFLGNPAHHVMMSIGNGQVIEAPHTGDVVKIINFPASGADAIRRILGSPIRGGGPVSSGPQGDPGDTKGITDKLGSPVSTASVLSSIFQTSSASTLLAALMGSVSGAVSSAPGAPGSNNPASGAAGSSAASTTIPTAPSNPSDNARLGRQMAANRGWTGKEWDALYWLWMHESGWNANAVNPSSGAAGIPQALGHGHVFDLGDAKGQINWGLNYIANRYHDPLGAAAHERQYNWYERGAFDVLRDELAQLHKGEMVLPAGTAAKVRQLVETPQAIQQQGSGPMHRRTVPVQLLFYVMDGDEATARRHAKRFAEYVAEDHGIDMVASH